MSADLRHTPLHELHVELGAKMVPFAGYEMPVNYPDGILAEHRHCRQSAALFDVSHMGQLRLKGDDAARALETLVPVDVIDLGVHKQRYALLHQFARRHPRRPDDHAARERPAADRQCRLQGSRHAPPGHPHRPALHGGADARARAAGAAGPQSGEGAGAAERRRGQADLHDRRPRSGWPAPTASSRARATPAKTASRSRCRPTTRWCSPRRCCDEPEVKPAGLGARDTLRLEAGLCLYGHDIDDKTTPIEAGLTWAIQKVRRPGGARAGHYPGAAAIESQLATGVADQARGLGRPGTHAGARRRHDLRCTWPQARPRDERHHRPHASTSRSRWPTWPPTMRCQHHEVYAEVRGKRYPMRVSAMPFSPHRYYRG